jgi:hypothetical protein
MAAGTKIAPTSDMQPSPAGAHADQAAPHEHGLTPDEASLLDRMDILEPGDFKVVANLLRQHPRLRDQILARAQEVCGNDTVAKALELVDGQQAPGATAAAPAASSAAAPAAPVSANAVDVAKTDHPAGKAKAPEEFDYITSPLALEYDHAEQVKDHVEFIRNHPQLRDKVLMGAAEFDPQLAADVRAALQDTVSAPAAPTAAPVMEAPAAASTSATPQAAAPQTKTFDYITSPLALEYDHDEQVKDHVEFIRNNPGLRDAVLAGAAELDPKLAEEVRKALERGASAEAGWVTRARAYHDHHPELAAMFNSHTGGVCLGPDGDLDPNLVAKWQAAHGVAVDGRVGKATVSAASHIPFKWHDAAELAE